VGLGGRRQGWEIWRSGCAPIAGDGGVDLAGPGVDAAGDGLGFFEALLPEPCGYREGAGSVVAEDEDCGFFVELLVGSCGDVVHGDEGAAFQVRGIELPLLADVEEEGRMFGREEGFGLGDSEFEIHGLRIQA
jgi:hypothetical protein